MLYEVITPRAGVQGLRNLGHDVRRRIVTDGMDRIEPQPVETVLLDPVERVVNEEIAHRARAGAIEVDRRAPGGLMLRVEELRTIGVEVVSYNFV